jgi:hypothetical protein
LNRGVLGKRRAFDRPAIGSLTVTRGDQTDIAPPQRAINRHHSALCRLDRVEEALLVNRDPTAFRDLDPRQDSGLVEPIMVLRLIDIGLDLVDKTGRPETDPTEP